MGVLVSGLLAILCAAVPLAAQQSQAANAPKGVCFHAKAKPACSTFLLTNAGVYVLTRVDGSDPPLRAVADWGLMANVSTRDAIGVSVFANADEAGFAVGPTARYRRWAGPRASFEIGVGTPAFGVMERGSILGLVKWSPATFFAVSARPELLRRRIVAPDGQDLGIQAWGRASIGVEVGEVPGLVIAGATGVVLLLGYFLWNLQPASS